MTFPPHLAMKCECPESSCNAVEDKCTDEVSQGKNVIDQRIPVYIITGTPGSGKSTFINSLLAEMPSGTLPAVIVHRFAYEFGLETQPINSECCHCVYDFGSGCVCCSPTGDMVRTLTTLLGERATYTHLFCETTGLAEPAVFCKIFTRHPDIAAAFYIQKVVSVVNLQSCFDIFSEDSILSTKYRNKLEKQLNCSDCVVVTDFKYTNDKKINDGEIRNRILRKAPQISTLYIENNTSNRLSDIACKILDCSIPTIDRSSLIDKSDDENMSLYSLISKESHDRRYKSTCIVEIGEVLWNKCIIWLQTLIQQNDDLNRIRILRLKGKLLVSPCKATLLPIDVYKSISILPEHCILHYRVAVVDDMFYFF